MNSKVTTFSSDFFHLLRRADITHSLPPFHQIPNRSPILLPSPTPISTTHQLQLTHIPCNIRTKIILSSDPSKDPHFLAAQLYDEYLVLWRQGYWREIQFPVDGFCCEDVLLYQGQLVFMGNGRIYAYDVEKGHVSASILTDYRGKHFFVESTGDPLFVQVFCDYEEGELFTCEVFKVVLGELQLVKVENLGDRALFVGHNLGISISASEYPRCNANCVYYLPEQLQPLPMMVRFCLEDGSNECIVVPLPQDFSRKAFISALWLKNA